MPSRSHLIVTRDALLALSLAALSACVHHATAGDVAATVREHPAVRIERRDGSTIHLERASVVGDSVIGTSGSSRVAIALSDVARADTPASTARRAGEGMVILFAPLAFVVMAFTLARH